MTQRRSNDTRAKILSTAMTLFSQNGYDNTGVALICQQAEISKGAFYHHFPSKHSVFVTLLEEWLVKVEDEFSNELGQSSSVPEGLIAMTGSFSQIVELSRGYLPLFLEFWLHSIRDPEIWERTTKPYFNYVSFFQHIFERGKQEGTIQIHNSENAAFTLIALALGLLLQNMMNPDYRDWGKVSQDAISNLLIGLQRSN